MHVSIYSFQIKIISTQTNHMMEIVSYSDYRNSHPNSPFNSTHCITVLPIGIELDDSSWYYHLEFEEHVGILS